MAVVIRRAVASDIDAITRIYAHHVQHGTGTFETEPPDPTEMERRWSEVEARGLPWLVAEDCGDAGVVVLRSHVERRLPVGSGGAGEGRAHGHQVGDGLRVAGNHRRKDPG